MIQWFAARRQRLAAMAMSAAVHGTFVFLLVRFQPEAPPLPQKSLPDRLKEFPEKRILYFHPSQLLPPVSPEPASADEGLTIRQPQPELQTAKLSDPDPAPVALPARALPPPPAPPGPATPSPAPPAPIPPAEKPVAEKPVAVSQTPSPPPTPPTEAVPEPPPPPPPKPKVRLAAAPPPVPVTAPAVVLEPGAPAVSSPAGVPSLSATGLAESRLPGRPSPPPPPAALPAETARAGSKAIEMGVSRGEGEGRQTNATVIPGVAIAGAGVKPPSAVPSPVPAASPVPPPSAAPARPPVDSATSEISIAQRPGARSVPASVENVFGDRVIFTTVLTVPVELEGRTQWQDWTAWFAEPAGSPGARFMRPPKVAPRQAAVRRPGNRRLFVVAKLNAEGVAVVVQVNPAIEDSGLPRGIEAWAWRPAQRGSLPVPVELVIELP